MNQKMTQLVKAFAHELGVDLVGFANIERFDEAPIKMSPKGIMPTAKTVIVCAVHHPDATIELEGGLKGDSQIFESYRVQYTMNAKLDHISFRIAHFLEQSGFNAVPIVSSNIWRYRNYKELDAVFSPDMSHIYASVCAGLCEMGWNGLALSPEYGPRNRFVSIITDAELEPTPLLPGGTLCDMCGECIRCCPTDAYRKEVNGVNYLNIKDRDGKVYTHKFANKNLWRCAWGEHFDLDLDDEIPDVVTEKEIVDRCIKKGKRGGEMGVCLKVCVPKNRRYKDEAYSPFYRRRRLIADPNLPVSREVYDRMSRFGLQYHADRISILSAAALKEKGCDLTEKLPEAKSLVVISAKAPAADKTTREDLKTKHRAPVDHTMKYGLRFACYDIGRTLEKMGYSVLPDMTSILPATQELIAWTDLGDDSVSAVGLITDAPLEERDWMLAQTVGEDSDHSLKEILWETVSAYGADLMGVAPAERIDNIVKQLRPLKDGEPLFDVKDKNGITMPFDPVITETARKLTVPSDYLKDAKNVLVIGLAYSGEAARRAGREPAEAVGPFIFSQSQAQNELSMIGVEAVKALRRAGYKAVLSRDLIGMGSPIASPRGEYSSPFDCAFEAVAAGLGDLTYSGTVNTEKYGVNQRFICVVTDAPLEADAVKPNVIQAKCESCKNCILSCPMKALEAKNAVTVEVEGNSFLYIPLDTATCQWASRYVLTGADGDDCLGNTLNLMPNGKVTVEQLDAGLRQRDPITKFRPGNAEKCVTECPLIFRK
ncbi:MAG: hypothetical protein J6C26_01385 [Clostridia bacterium]|nr:hypothetical protein [Clostridia bacterium]